MNKLKFFAGIAMLFVLGACVANAQASRTWVSGVGDDVNPCSRTAPCKTFAGAISKTAAGGEINALDPGGYGSVTITKSITIDGGPGIAGITSPSTNGITINSASAVVTIRNLAIDGLGTGLSGIKLVSGQVLHIQNCKIFSYVNYGIDIEPAAAAQVFVTNTISQDNGQDGLYAIGSGVYVQITIDSSHFENNGNGIYAADFTRFAVRNTDASGSSAGAGFIALANSGFAVMSIVDSTTANNNFGIQSGGGSAPSSVRIANVGVLINNTGMVIGSNGSIASAGNNFNTGSGAPNATLPLQ